MNAGGRINDTQTIWLTFYCFFKFFYLFFSSYNELWPLASVQEASKTAFLSETYFAKKTLNSFFVCQSTSAISVRIHLCPSSEVGYHCSKCLLFFNVVIQNCRRGGGDERGNQSPETYSKFFFCSTGNCLILPMSRCVHTGQCECARLFITGASWGGARVQQWGQALHVKGPPLGAAVSLMDGLPV